MGNKAILWGAVAGYIPDIDFAIGHFLMETVNGLAFHRGIMHSIVFCAVLAPLLGIAVHRLYRNDKNSTWRGWSLLFFLSLVTHPLLDCFTTWGTQLFWPSEYRVSWSSIFIVDPVYTLPMLVGTIWLMFKPKQSEIREKIGRYSLAISTVYLLFTLVNRNYVDSIFEKEFERQNIEYSRYFTKPTPLNQFLWNVTAETEDAYHLAYYSHFDENKEVKFSSIPKNRHLLGEMKNHPHVQYLIETIDGYYSVERQEDRVIIHDLRFGQAAGLDGLKPHIVLSYHLLPDQPGDYKSFTVHQVRNNDIEPKKALSQLWQRIKGI